MHTSLAPSCVLRCLTCCLHIPQRDILFCGLVGVVRGARLGLYEIFGGEKFLVCLNCRAGRVFGCELELGLDAHGYRLHRIQSMIHCTRYIQFQVISENSKKKMLKYDRHSTSKCEERKSFERLSALLPLLSMCHAAQTKLGTSGYHQCSLRAINVCRQAGDTHNNRRSLSPTTHLLPRIQIKWRSIWNAPSRSAWMEF